MRYSRLKVLWNDWPALAASAAIPITWVIHFGFPYLHRGALPWPLWFPAGVSCSLIALTIWRISRVAWFFANGATITGKITNLHIVKDRGRLEFEFEVKGRRISSWMPIHKTKAVLSLSPGDCIDVLFDEAEPTRAIVKSLYST